MDHIIVKDAFLECLKVKSSEQKKGKPLHDCIYVFMNYIHVHITVMTSRSN